MPKFEIVHNWPKNIFPDFFLLGGGGTPPYPTPVSSDTVLGEMKLITGCNNVIVSYLQSFINKLTCGCKSQGGDEALARSADARGPKGREREVRFLEGVQRVSK